MCEHIDFIYKYSACTNTFYELVRSETGKLYLRLCLIAKTLFHVGLFTIWLYRISVPEGWHIEWIWKFSLMSVWKFCIYFVKFLLIFDGYSTFEHMYAIYTCRVQLFLYGNDFWFAISIIFQPCNYIVWTFITSIYLNVGTISYSTQYYR